MWKLNFNPSTLNPKIMKTITIIILLYLSSLASAQVGVGNTDPKATLDISASNITSPTNEDGILIPRIDNFPTTNPTADQDGMMVFYTGSALSGKGFYYWENAASSWIAIISPDTKNTLDGAYDEGGMGLGRTINVDSGSLEFSGDGSDDYTLTVTNTNAKSGIEINTSGDIITGPGNTQQSVEINNTINTNASFANNYGIFARMTVNGSATNGTIAGYRSWFLPAGNAESNQYGFYSSNQNEGDGDNYGFYNRIINDGNGTKYGLYSRITSNGTGDKYGILTTVDNSTGGTSYGIYSTATGSTNFAGYFSGRVSIGLDVVNRYILPTTDGTNGQVMTTDGAGNVSFQDATVNTDNQTIDNINLVGTVLGISLDNDGVAPATVDLASLQDGTGTDDQQIDTFGLAGNTLGLSIEDDGQPVQTVNLNDLSFNVNNFSLSVVYRSLVWTHGGTGYEKLPLDFVAFDSQSEFNIPNNRFIANTTGFYQINATLKTVNWPSVPSDIGLAVYKNGALFKEVLYRHELTGQVSRNLNCLVQLNASDYIEFYIYSTFNGLLMDNNPSKSWFEIQRIR